jgi:hypothetical protein
MFPNFKAQTKEARVNRAIDRMKECTTLTDLNRVYENCGQLIDHLFSEGDRVLAKKLHNAKIDMQIEIELPVLHKQRNDD